MANHNIEEKVEEAFKQFLIEQDIGPGGTTLDIPIVLGFDILEVPNTCVWVHADDASIPEDEVDLAIITGNQDVTVTVEVRSHASDVSRDVHKTNVATVHDLLYTDVVGCLNALTSPITDFTARVWRTTSRDRRIEEHSRITTQEGVLYCLPS